MSAIVLPWVRSQASSQWIPLSVAFLEQLTMERNSPLSDHDP
jgi:hypothetical protein